jgi:Lon protease-like protein
MSDGPPFLENFSGTARLFPLPNLVLFPFITQGLHVFEPRYRQLTADALAGDRLIALVMLRPGWEEDYEGRPPVCEVACLGRIIADQRLADGRYNLQLRGLVRARLCGELAPAKPYRTARVELLSDVNLPAGDAEAHLRAQLAEVAPPWCPVQEPAGGVFRRLMGHAPLGALCDILSYSLPLAADFKQTLLETPDVTRRARRLIEYLGANTPPVLGKANRAKFPPDFSTN